MSTAAARAPLAGASVVFLVATRAGGVHDDALDRALAWVRQIAAAVGPGVLVDRLGPAPVAAAAVRAAGQRAITEGALARDVLDHKLGGLRDHSLVLVSRGLDVEGQPGPERQSLLLHNTAAVAPDGDAVLTRAHLDRMELADDRVVPIAGADELADLAALVDAIRHSPFMHVYLASCSGERPVDALAARLSALTATTVFFNRAPILFSDAPQPVARIAARGYRPFAPRTGAPALDLTSTPDGFLPGATDRVP